MNNKTKPTGANYPKFIIQKASAKLTDKHELSEKVH